MASPILFLSTDTGAPVLSGQVGALLGVLDATLCINKMFTGISGASFVDNTAEARLQGGAAFKLFQGPTLTNDEAYFGLQVKSDRLTLNFGTPGVQGAAVTLVKEYWNGSAWAALTGVVDGTSGLTASGKITWTIPGNWATTSVNGVTLYWIRLRFTAGSWSTNPLVNYCTHAGWSQPFTPAGNVCDYQPVGGNGFFLDVNDNAPGAAGAKEARVVGCEAMTALGRANGTNLFPTAAQAANGLFTRKSNTADGTARPWVLSADDRTFRLFILSGDATTPVNSYYTTEFGDLFSVVSGDGYRTHLTSRNSENVSTAANEMFSSGISLTPSGAGNVADCVARSYTAAVGAVALTHYGDVSFGAPISSSLAPLASSLANPNAPDGGFYLAPITIEEGPYGPRRGRYRGVWHCGGNYGNGNTLTGTGDLAGRSFYIIGPVGNASGSTCFFALETSDTWDTST